LHLLREQANNFACVVGREDVQLNAASLQGKARCKTCTVHVMEKSYPLHNYHSNTVIILMILLC
jgi:hypothetical protein